MLIPETRQEVMILQIIGQKRFDRVKRDFLESDNMTEVDLSNMIGKDEANLVIHYKHRKEAV